MQRRHWQFLRTAQLLCSLAFVAACDRNPLDKLGLSWLASSEADAKSSPDEPEVGVNAALQFKSQSKIVLTLKIADLQRRTPGVQPRVHDVFEQADIVYEGVAVEPTLDSVYGPDWSLGGSVVVSSLDGRKVALPVQRFRKHKAWLVWRRMDRPGFALTPGAGAGSLIEAAPLYLVWDNLNDKVLREEGETGWVPAVAAINLVDTSGGLAALSLPADASPAAIAGLALYKVHCAHCHSINGLGGSGGSELNVPMNVTEYWNAAALAEFIDDPRQVRAGSPMPKLPASIADRPLAIAQLVAFLREMVQHKVAVKP